MKVEYQALIDAPIGKVRKLKILHVITGLGTGGAEALLFRLSTGQSEFEHEVVALAGRDWYTPLLEDHGIKVHHLNINSPAAVARGFLTLGRLMKRSRPEIVQSWMYGPNLVAGLLAKRHGVPVVWGIHSSSLEGLGLATRLSARICSLLSDRVPSRIINCSIRSADHHASIGYSRNSTVIVHNGYDGKSFFPDEDLRFSARSELGIEPGTFVIGCIARWNPRKDVPNLLQALHLLNASRLPIQTILVGRDLDTANRELARSLEALQCAGPVRALGHRSDLPALARAFDIHVLPSATEAFPNVVAETMLSGTPNVVTNVGDAALIVGDSGWVVPRRDPAQFALAIEGAFHEWRGNSKRWQLRRTEARRLIADRFSFERMVQGYEQVWRDIVDAESREVG